MSEKPEALFEGVEWDFEFEIYVCSLGSLVQCRMWPSGRGKFIPQIKTQARGVEQKLGKACAEAEALAWLRTKVLQARDELCEKTGTVAMQGWQPIETAPKDGKFLVAPVGLGVVVHALATSEGIVEWATGKPFKKYCEPTLWMPLLSVPEVE